MPDPRNGHRYRQLKAAMTGTQPCVICHRHIDDTITDPNHDWARTIHHEPALATIPDPAERRRIALDPAHCYPAHRRCNNLQGTQPLQPSHRSRDW